MKELDLIRKIKAGDKKQLEKIYIKHREEFIRWITSNYNISDSDAKDIYQQSLILFYENIVKNKLQELRSTIKTYLFGIGKNLMYEHVRKNARYLGVSEVSMQESVLEVEEIDDTMVSKLHLVKEALQQLGDPCKKILELMYYHNKSMDEISQELNYKNRETTKNLKYKCMLRLRKIFQAELSNKTRVAYG